MTTPTLPPLPKPDTHCFDEDTGRDVWSHSATSVTTYGQACADAARADLLAEVERLREALGMKLLDETMLSELGVHGGSLNARLEGGACRLLAQAFADQFDESGATNYLEVSLTDPKDHARAFVVTLQRKAGKTPHALRMEAEAEVERLRVDAERYRWLRAQDSDDFEFAVVKNPHFDVYQSPEELDAAIDSANQGESK